MAVKRKSLAPLKTSPKKALKATSISANNTPAKKLQTPVGPIKKGIHAKQVNLNKQTPSKDFNQKQKKGPLKPADGENDNKQANLNKQTPSKGFNKKQKKGSLKPADGEDDKKQAKLNKQTPNKGFNQKQKKGPVKPADSEDDENEDADNKLEMEEDAEDADSDIEEEESIDGDNDAADDVEDNDSDDDTKQVPKIAKNAVKDTKQKQTKKAKTPVQDKIPAGENFVIFVGHLNAQTSEDELRAHFLKAGPVVEVDLAKFRPKFSRGFGFVQMKDEAGFKKALKLNNTTLGKRQIVVEISKKSLTKTDDKPKPKSKPTKKKAT